LPEPYGLYRIRSTGGAAERVGSFGLVNDDNWLYHFAVDDKGVYLMSEGDYTSGAYSGYINVYDKSGAFVRRIDPVAADDCSVPILGLVAAAGGTVFWNQHYVNKPHTVCALAPGGIFSSANPQQPLLGGHGGRLAADGSHLFWAESNAVYRVSHAGGAPEKLADVSGTRALALGGDILFVLDGSGTVQAVTAPGSWHAIYTGAGDLAADGAHAYVTGSINGHPAVVRMNPDGSGQTELTAGLFDAMDGVQEHPQQLAVDDARVYFHIFDEGKVISVCK